jgi:hypothetical protein
MNDLQAKLNWSIDKGISFLSERQFPNGEFCCYFSNNERMLVYDTPPGGWCVADSVTFPTILIANSLIFLAHEPKINIILDKVAGFLLEQRKVGSAWNHFTKGHHLYPLCPFDLDVTACASVFLKDRKVNFPSNTDLILSNVNSKKLFFTWITPRLKLNSNKSYWRLSLLELKNPIKSFFFWIKMECSKGDIDGVVNANVLYYLGETSKTKPAIDYLVKIIADGKEDDCDKWYRNVFTVYYFISRNYYIGILNDEKQTIIDRVIKQLKPDGCIGESALDTALAVCTLLNLNYNEPQLIPAIQFLIDQQFENGSWEKMAYYYGGPKKMVNWGSEELTTGICLEALVRYKKLLT